MTEQNDLLQILDHIALYEKLSLQMIALAPLSQHSNGKRPLHSGWQDAATSQASIAEKWFRQSAKAGVGIVTGIQSKVLVLDVDPRNGGDATLQLFERQNGKLPDTPLVETGGGGRHYYFRLDSQEATFPKCLGAGLDLKWNGGFVCAPPTVHASGRRYFWDAVFHPEHQVFAEVPRWFLGCKVGVQTPPRPLSSTSWAPNGLMEGQRNESLTSVFGHLLRRYVDPNLAASLLHSFNLSHCQPPLPQSEVNRIVESICKKEFMRRNLA